MRSKRIGVKAAFAAVLTVPVAFGALTACGEGSMDQTKIENERATAFTELGAVEVTDAYCVNAMQKEVEYLLKLDEDKLLFYFYVNAGLKPKAASSYGGGWEGALIGGHTLGHYLTAISQAYANANTAEADKQELRARIAYIAEELQACQQNAVKAGAEAGFIWGAAPASASRGDPEAQFDFVEKNRTNITTEAWVPWYTMHKIIAGLLDAATLAGNDTAKEVVIALGDWVYNRVSAWSAATQKTVLGIEYGGMNDCMYNLYLLTGEEKYAVAAHAFDEETLFEKVRSGAQDYLNGLHANTTIPKIIGALNRYAALNGKTVGGETVNAEAYLQTAEDFWDCVIERHTYVTGGNSEWEHFGKDDVLNRERTNANCETCNTYNMLKLSRTLFTLTGKKKYLDYYENTYYNAILSSQNPETGMTTYFQPMATGYFKVYSTEESNFWCCTGSGMESFTKLGDSIYYEAGNAVYVSLYLSSKYSSEAVEFTQTADLENSDEATLKVTRGNTILRLRRPYWSGSFAVTVNGKPVVTTGSEEFVSVAVKKNDVVKVTMKKTVRAYNLPDGKDTYAFLYGPFVLSAELGEEGMTKTTTGVNVTIPAKAVGNTTYTVNADTVADFMDRIDENLKREQDGTFTLVCANGTLVYSIHYRQYEQRYGIYMNFTAGGAAENPEDGWARQDTVQPGYGQYENDALHDMNERNSVSATNVEGVGTYRKANANGYFTYRIVVTKGVKNRIVVTLLKEDNGKTLVVKSGNVELYSKTLDYRGGEPYYDVVIELPDSLVSSAKVVTYATASGGSESATVLSFTFSGLSGKESARVWSYIYSEYAD